MAQTHRRFTKEIKLNVVREYTSGTSAAELTRKYDIHANLVYKWTQEYRLNPTGAFRSAHAAEILTDDKTLAELERVIGRLTVENGFLKKALKHAEAELTKMNLSVRDKQQSNGVK